MKLLEEDECHFIAGLKCKWPIDEDTLKESIENGESDDVTSLRPFEDTGICTNCLLGMVLNTLQKERNVTND